MKYHHHFIAVVVEFYDSFATVVKRHVVPSHTKKTQLLHKIRVFESLSQLGQTRK